MTQLCKIDLVVFAHNEAQNIQFVLSMLQRQDIFDQPDLSVRVLVLANGCTDATVQIARSAIVSLSGAAPFEIYDLAMGGKSKTWNEFVHSFSRDDADYLIFSDADIDIPQTDALRNLVNFVRAEPKRVVVSSCPIKDIVYAPENLSLRDKMIAAASGTLNNWRKGVCGQLYILRADIARSFHLPIGLPVEDGFVRAMVLTNLLREPEDLDRIDGDESIFHVYASERGVIALIRHQVRIVIGGAVNTVVFDTLRKSEIPDQMLKGAAEDPDWLDQVCKQELPKRYGYVPLHYLTKRSAQFRRHSLKRKCIVVVGLSFDAIVYVISQIKMARGAGAGYW